jgi:hypothetical protein
MKTAQDNTNSSDYLKYLSIDSAFDSQKCNFPEYTVSGIADRDKDNDESIDEPESDEDGDFSDNDKDYEEEYDDEEEYYDDEYADKIESASAIICYNPARPAIGYVYSMHA